MARRPLRRFAAMAFAALAALPVAALSAPAAAAKDVIVVIDRDGSEKPQRDLTVTSETLDTIKYLKGGTERSYKTATVARIDYGAGSPAWDQGLKAAAANDWVNAETLFASASKDSEPGWVAAQALLRQAEAAAARGAGRLESARAAIEEFIKRFPDHRLLPQALLAKARYAARAGDRTTADGAVDEVLQLAKAGRITPDWQLRAQLALGDLRLDAGDNAGAATAYEAASSAAAAARAALGERPDLAPVVESLGLAARVGSASTMLARNDVAGARGFYQKLAADAGSNPAVTAAAANGLAECDFREGGKFKQAQLAFSHVAVDSAGVPEERARALYYLGRCAEELGRAGKEPNGALKAAAYYAEVANRYPETRWARLAQDAKP